ncbi:MAG: AraC family transcriptional regulator [Paenibacillus sp.]|nr:AraC family transcriptional regulator [Paenibacillus sp.]
MELDREILNAPPIKNPFVENGFKEYPVYARQELLREHKQRLHTQPGIEINLTLEGKAAYVIGHEVYTQSPGQLLVFSGRVPHQVYINPSCQYKRAVICFDEAGLMKETEFRSMPGFEMFGDFEPSYKQWMLEPEMFATIRWIVSRITEEIGEQKPGWREVVGSQLISLAVFIRRSAEGRERVPGSDPVAICCEYIQNHLHEELSLQNVSRLVHMSSEHLTRLFKRERGVTFYQYVLQRRVLECKRMLRHCPEMTLTDIAYAVGFASAAQFSRVFKSMTGQLPSQYRTHGQR